MEVSKSEFFKSRLFLPLTSEAFEWYEKGKCVEVRIKKGRFKNIHKFNYKYAELRKGYNGKSVYAQIDKIDEYSSIKRLSDGVKLKSIIPLELSKQESIKKLDRYVNSEATILAIHLSFISIIEG